MQRVIVFVIIGVSLLYLLSLVLKKLKGNSNKSCCGSCKD